MITTFPTSDGRWSVVNEHGDELGNFTTELMAITMASAMNREAAPAVKPEGRWTDTFAGGTGASAQGPEARPRPGASELLHAASEFNARVAEQVDASSRSDGSGQQPPVVARGSIAGSSPASRCLCPAGNAQGSVAMDGDGGVPLWRSGIEHPSPKASLAATCPDRHAQSPDTARLGARSNTGTSPAEQFLSL